MKWAVRPGPFVWADGRIYLHLLKSIFYIQYLTEVSTPLTFLCVFGVVIMLAYCPAAQSPKGGDHALLQNATQHVGIHGSHQTTGHVSTNPCPESACLQQTFLCIIFRKGFLLGRQPRRPIWCSVRLMFWALTGWPPTPSTSAAMLAALRHLFPKHNLWI